MNKIGKKTQRLFRIIDTSMSYSAARSIIEDYNEDDEPYLRSMVRRHVLNAENELACADEDYLLHMARTIKGVADKVLKSHPIGKNIRALTKTADPAERELLEERICIQLEGCNIPDSNWVSNFYSWAKTIHPN